ncbi:exported protein family 4 Plasmodium, putative [Plasmodium sp.]|nr:exported protein family 4 Plasmodium, putative [Plasmodium sp.]
MVEEPFEKKGGSSRVLLKDKKAKEERKKKIQKTISIKRINENNNNNSNILLKNLNDEEINEQRNTTNERIHKKFFNDKGVDNISNNRQMEEKNIICKDINSNLLMNENEINDNHKVQEIKEKFVKDLMKNKNKGIFEQIEKINSDGTMTKIKNSLYRMIFKGINFWKGLAIYLGALSGAAIGQLILTFILKFPSTFVFSHIGIVSYTTTLISFSSFVGLIFLTIIIVIFLLMWLWPSRRKLTSDDNTENKRNT